MMWDLKIKKIIETLLAICFVGERGEAPNGNKTYGGAGYVVVPVMPVCSQAFSAFAVTFSIREPPLEYCYNALNTVSFVRLSPHRNKISNDCKTVPDRFGDFFQLCCYATVFSDESFCDVYEAVCTTSQRCVFSTFLICCKIHCRCLLVWFSEHIRNKGLHVLQSLRLNIRFALCKDK